MLCYAFSMLFCAKIQQKKIVCTRTLEKFLNVKTVCGQKVTIKVNSKTIEPNMYTSCSCMQWERQFYLKIETCGKFYLHLNFYGDLFRLIQKNGHSQHFENVFFSNVRHLLTLRESPQKKEVIAKAGNIFALLKKTIIF